MHYLIILSSVLASYVCFVEGQQACETPNRVAGKCKSLFECAPLLAIVNKKSRSPTDIEYLKKSQCGFQETVPTVCCPPDREDTQKICFTPDGYTGKCVDITQCKHIANMLKPPISKENITFMQNSRCLGKTQYSVCCGVAPTTKLSAEHEHCRTAVSAYPPDPATACCGMDSRVNNKILFGYNPVTKVDEYPWLALIYYYKDGDDEKLLCGGVLISGRYVLTAAHCVVGDILKIGKPHTVRLGEYDVTHDGPDCVLEYDAFFDCSDYILKIPIESIIPHPEYIFNTPERRNDIALIRLGYLAPFSDFIRPICLPQTDLTMASSDFKLFIAGWGANKTHYNTVIKEHVDLPFVNAQECQETYNQPGRSIRLWDKQLCARGVNSMDACKGDSGGPLMHKNGSTYEAVGVISFGLMSCGTAAVPGIYTKVFEYKDWILSNIKT